jgi:hypothetical protein
LRWRFDLSAEVWRAAGRRNEVEDGLELSKNMVAQELTLVKNNLLVIRKNVAGLTQWGSSWLREKVCGGAGFERIVEICGKSQMWRMHGQDFTNASK